VLKGVFAFGDLKTFFCNFAKLSSLVDFEGLASIFFRAFEAKLKN